MTPINNAAARADILWRSMTIHEARRRGRHDFAMASYTTLDGLAALMPAPGHIFSYYGQSAIRQASRAA